MHDFWKQEDPQPRQNDRTNFGKNMALLGASLVIMGMENRREQTASDWGEVKSEPDRRSVRGRAA